MCEEPGFEIYINTDEEGKYYQTRYRLWLNTEDDNIKDYYCDSIEELVDYLSLFIDFDEEPKDLSEVQAKVNEYNESDKKISGIESAEIYEFDSEDGCTFAEMDQFIPQPKN